MKKQFLSLLSIGALGLFSSATYAASDGKRGGFAINGGQGFLSGDASSPDAAWNAGASLNFSMGASSTFGLYADYQTSKSVSGTVLGRRYEGTTKYMPLGVQFNFYSGAFYLGLNAGVVKIDNTVTISSVSATSSNTEPSVGGQLGFEFPVSSSVNFGLEGRLYNVMSDPSFNLMQANGVLKFVF